MSRIRLALLAIFLLQPAAAWSKNLALVIGISGYPEYPEDNRLSYTGIDARNFAATIESAEGGAFRLDDVHVLVDSKATRRTIFAELKWLGRRATSEDTVYFFFAGHGQQDTSGRVYLMPFDGNPEDPEALGWRADRFLEDLRDIISSKNLLIFVDACYSGSIFVPGGNSRSADTNAGQAIALAWKAAQAGARIEGTQMAFLSASSNQRSWEDASLREGLFTHYLVSGLKGAADDAGDGNKIVTASELRSFLMSKVEEHARRSGFGNQSPMVAGAFAPDFPLAVRGSSGPSMVAPTRTSYLQVSIAGIANHPLDWLTQPPSGHLILGNIPFTFDSQPPRVFASRTHFERNLPASGELEVSIEDATAVHILVNGGWVSRIKPGERVGYIELRFAGDRSIVFPLSGGVNIREGWEYESALSTLDRQSQPGMIWENVWQEQQMRGGTTSQFSARAYLDLLSLSVPAGLGELKRISFLDSGLITDEGIDPTIEVAAVTVETH